MKQKEVKGRFSLLDKGKRALRLSFIQRQGNRKRVRRNETSRIGSKIDSFYGEEAIKDFKGKEVIGV